MIASATKPVRLPEAVTVRHGPVNLLSQFFLAADQYVRDRGVKLYIRHDMDELLRLNEQQTAAGNWYPVSGTFDHRLSRLSPSNSYWIAGVNDAGEIVVAQSMRLYRWGTSSLADHAASLLFGDSEPTGPCRVECPQAFLITGNVAYGGALWIRPDYRRIGIGGLVSQTSRSYAMATWGTSWVVAYVKRDQIDKKMHEVYGFTKHEFSIRFPDTQWGNLDFALCWQDGLDLLARVEEFTFRLERKMVAA